MADDKSWEVIQILLPRTALDRGHAIKYLLCQDKLNELKREKK